MWPSQMPPQQHQQQQASRALGMTSPISLAPPKPIDIEKTKELHEALIPHNIFESDAELNIR